MTQEQIDIIRGAIEYLCRLNTGAAADIAYGLQMVLDEVEAGSIDNRGGEHESIMYRNTQD